jgi:2-methylfumaryl-CoA isomerase
MLEGLRILEISSFVAAPLGGMTLAQLGAEVIRVDPIGGAPDVRRWPLAPSGASIYWAGLNKGKRSVTVDLRSARGGEILARLAAGTGIVLTNAETGFPLATGPESHTGPVNNVVPAWDVACGLYAAVGILAAKRHRTRTGDGSAMRLPLADVALATAGNLGYLGEAVLNGVDRPRIGNHLYGGFARDFATSDAERVMVVALTARHFTDLGAVTGLTAPSR